MPLQQGPPTPPASAPTEHLPGASGPLRGGAGACRSGLNSANLVSTPRAEAGSPSLPLYASRPQHLQTVHFPSRCGRGGGNPSLTPTPPPENAFLTGTRCRARCKPCGRRTIPRHGAHNHRPPGPAARTAREWGAPGGPRHSGPGTPLEQPAASKSAGFTAPTPFDHTHPPPAPAHSA